MTKDVEKNTQLYSHRKKKKKKKKRKGEKEPK